MVLFNCFKQVFNCITDLKILILVAKKNTLKATETVKSFFSCTFYHGPRFTSHQFDAATLLKKKSFRESEIAISSDLNRSSLQNFSANLVGASWVIKLMESMIKWPTTLSKLISTTDDSFGFLKEIHIMLKMGKMGHLGPKSILEVSSKSVH